MKTKNAVLLGGVAGRGGVTGRVGGADLADRHWLGASGFGASGLGARTIDPRDSTVGPGWVPIKNCCPCKKLHIDHANCKSCCTLKT